MDDLKLNSQSLSSVISALAKIVLSGDSYRLSVKKWRKKRSLSASAQYYVWISVAAKEYGVETEYMRKWMKHELAWPILLRGQCDYSVKMLYMLNQSGYNMLSFRRKINMVDMFGITRFMDSKQHNELRDDMQRYWAERGIQLRYLNGNEHD